MGRAHRGLAPDAEAGRRPGLWDFGERVRAALWVSLGLSLLVLLLDALRTGFRAPTLEWLPVAVFFAPALLFGPVYIVLLTLTRPRQGRKRQRPRPVLTLSFLAVSCGCWLSFLVFLLLSHTVTDLRYEDCDSIPLDYPAPFLSPEGGLHHACLPDPLLSAALLIQPGAALGVVFSLPVLLAWGILLWCRRRRSRISRGSPS